MFLRQIGDGTRHPIITDIRGPQIQQCRQTSVNLMALHAEDMVIDVIHGVAIACAAKMGGSSGSAVT